MELLESSPDNPKLPLAIKDSLKLSKNSLMPWKRLFVEGVVIVGSILLAFMIDAWWVDHKKNDDIREVLSLVEIETHANLANLAESIAHHEQILMAIRVAHDKDSIETVTGKAVIEVEVFESTSDALQTLISTGLLGSIDNVDLRVSLIALNGLVKELAEKELAAVKFRDAARRRIASLGVRIYEDIPISSPIYADIELLNLLAMRASEEKGAVESGRKLETHLQTIAAMFDVQSGS